MNEGEVVSLLGQCERVDAAAAQAAVLTPRSDRDAVLFG